MSRFFSIKYSSETLYKEKGSKFIAIAIPVSTEEDIKQELFKLKQKYHDASHICYAWVLGLQEQTYRANDDGEPNHTAGDPILGQIKSYRVTNVLVAVVRYFGGTKLGVGGLIQAYRTAAAQALEKASRVEIFDYKVFRLHFDYSLLSEVERLVTTFPIEIIVRDYQSSCIVEGRVPAVKEAALAEHLSQFHKIQWQTI